MNIAEELEPIAREAAKIVGQQQLPGSFVVIIRGDISPNKTASVGWEWFFHAPTERVATDAAPVDLA
jgi:hypothetical protein